MLVVTVVRIADNEWRILNPRENRLAKMGRIGMFRVRDHLMTKRCVGWHSATEREKAEPIGQNDREPIGCSMYLLLVS